VADSQAGALAHASNLLLRVRDNGDVLSRSREKPPHDHHGAGEGLSVPARPAPDSNRNVRAVQCAGDLRTLSRPYLVGSKAAVVRTDLRLNLFNELEEASRAVTPRGDPLRQGRGGRRGQGNSAKWRGPNRRIAIGDLPAPFGAVASGFPSFSGSSPTTPVGGLSCLYARSERRVLPLRRGIGCVELSPGKRMKPQSAQVVHILTHAAKNGSPTQQKILRRAPQLAVAPKNAGSLQLSMV
jgi:hypothetical protein